MDNKDYLKSIYDFFLTEYQKSLIRIVRNWKTVSEEKKIINKEKIIDEDIKFSYKGKAINTFIIFSTSNGVYIFDNQKNISKKILSGKYYGITRYKNKWFFARSNNKGEKADRVSDIKVMDFNGKFTHLKPIIHGIPGEVHQIDIFNNLLYIPHTGYNEILKFSISNLDTTKSILSCKPIFLDIYKPSHLNSVFFDKSNNKIFFIAHNLSVHTGKKSDYIIYNEKLNRKKVVKTNTGSAHNIYAINGEIMICDSDNKKLVLNNKTIFESPKLLRGLSITDKYIFVGGSDISFERDKRFSSDATIYILDKEGKPLAQIDFPGLGNLYEIRQFNQKDYAMSSK